MLWLLCLNPIHDHISYNAILESESSCCNLWFRIRGNSSATLNRPIPICQKLYSKALGYVGYSRRRIRLPRDRTLMLRLPIPIPSKYPTPGAFPMGVALKQEKPP